MKIRDLVHELKLIGKVTRARALAHPLARAMGARMCYLYVRVVVTVVCDCGVALQKHSRNGCVTPQIHLRNTRGAIHTFICMRSAIVVSFMASEQGGVRLMRARVHLVAFCDR